jgi:HAE1 family hydrophobic/amphiphilic exporter-1
MQVKKQSDANAVAVSESVQKTIKTVQEAYKVQGVKVKV